MPPHVNVLHGTLACLHIKLTKTDSSDEQHHYLDLDDVDRLEDNRVYLKKGANIPGGSGANT